MVLNLTQPYVAEKMGVTASTILRYENGSIDNTKKMRVIAVGDDDQNIYEFRGSNSRYMYRLTQNPESKFIGQI